MRHTRHLLLLLATVFTLAFALLRPLPSRAETSPAPNGPSPASPGDLPAPAPLPGNPAAVEPTATANLIAKLKRKARAKARAKEEKKRKLAAAHRANFIFGERVVSYAKRLIGTPYRYGGTSPRSGFDCSGFVRYVYSHFGISLPHSSFADIVRGRSVGRGQLEPGDLVFFDSAGHVGIYVGHDSFIHAPHSGTVVRISTMSGWYGARFVGARRVR
jgi:cell wall-associated NlpC family hydrolase